MTVFELSKKIGKILASKKLKLSVCESCTGGMLGSILTRIPGSSRYFQGGIIAYSDKIKKEIVGVKAATLKNYGAVSVEVAKEMARGVRKRLRSDIGIGITGIAGPSGGTKRRPVGLVYISVSNRKHVFVKRFLFKGNREQIRKKTCREALFLLIHYI